MKTIFIELPIIKKEGKSEDYYVNVSNINYIRKWVGVKGELQSVVYFNGDKKYLVVDKTRDALVAIIEKRTQ